jgi:DNA-binding beta-propeller fold protein YncE
MGKAGAGSKRRVGGAVLFVALCSSFLAAGAAHAADRVYWGEPSLLRIGFLSLDNSGFGTLEPAGASISNPEGTAIDPATERIYWLNGGDNQDRGAGISFANLDGSGGGVLTIPGAVFDEAEGLAIDPVGRRIYWANGGEFSREAIWSVTLQGTDLKKFDTSPATLRGPTGLALDPVNRRLYWVNRVTTNPVSVASLDNPGHGEILLSPGVSANSPRGLAIDPIGKRVYWADVGGNSISFAKLDGSGGGKLDATGADVFNPRGVAVDPFGGRVYWAQDGSEGPISFANLDGSGHGGNLKQFSLGGTFPVLRVSPRSTAPPAISGGTKPEAVLSCSQGMWAPDLVESFFYDAAQSFSTQWSRNGVDVPGATQSTFTAAAEGDYRCRVTATNTAGSTAVTTGPYHVGAPKSSGGSQSSGGPKISVSLRLATKGVRAGAPLAVTLGNGGDVAISGSLSGRSTVSGKHAVKLSARPFHVDAQASAIIKLLLPNPLRSQLVQHRKLSISLSASFAPAGGASQVVSQKVVARSLVKAHLSR